MTTSKKAKIFFAKALPAVLAALVFAAFFNLYGCYKISDAVGEMKIYDDIPIDIDSLEVEINAADFIIERGEKFFVESNLKYLKVEANDGRLYVNETKKFETGYNDATLKISIPDGTALNELTIKTGAGKLTADSLSCEVLTLEFGAGDAEIGSLTALSSAKINGGAGKISVSYGSIRDLEVKMGVGRLDLVSALHGDCNFTLGVGESNITVIGDRDDYALGIQGGVGKITVDGKILSDYADTETRENIIKILGGVGSVILSFASKA